MEEKIADYDIEEMREGQGFSFTRRITAPDVDDFSRLSGDTNPLHADDEFARKRGFEGRVVHGGLLAGLISKLIGVHLPGENCLLLSLNLKFASPVYIGDTVKVSAIVDRVSTAARSVVLDVTIEDPSGRAAYVKGNVQVGFTREKAK